MNTSEQAIITNFLNSGGAVYFEGVNIGVDHNDFPFWNYFGVDFLGQGAAHTNLNGITGEAGTFAADKALNYQNGTYADIHNNSFGATSGEVLLRSDDNIGRVVTNQTDTYRTITSSLLIGAIENGRDLNSKKNLMRLYLSFLTNNAGAEINSTSNEVDFGVVAPNGELAQVYIIQNIGIEDLSLTNISISGTAFTLNNDEDIVLAFGESVALGITFPNTATGDYNETITITTNDADFPNLEIPVSVSSYTFPNLEHPTSLEGVSENGTGSLQFTLNNSGQQDLNYWIEIINANRDSGEPDTYGYNWIDSNEDGYDFVWNDISELGTEVDFETTDDFVELELPFSFPFYGNLHDQGLFSTKGYITFGSDGVDYSNDAIQSPINPNDLIAVFWDDLNGLNGSFYYYYDEANTTFIAQYSHWQFYNGTGDFNFQVHLHENGDIEMFYNNMEGNLYSATVGIENADATDGLQVVYNAPYLEEYLAVKISYNVNWASIDSWNGTITEDSPQQIEITFPNTSQLSGDFNGIIRVHSNDFNYPIVQIPLSLNFNSTSNDNNTSPINGIRLNQNFPNPFNPETTIEFQLKQPGRTSLAVYDLKGRKVKDLVTSFRKEGAHSVVWNGENNQGNNVASGVYFYRLTTNDLTETKKMILMK